MSAILRRTFWIIGSLFLGLTYAIVFAGAGILVYGILLMLWQLVMGR